MQGAKYFEELAGPLFLTKKHFLRISAALRGAKFFEKYQYFSCKK